MARNLDALMVRSVWAVCRGSYSRAARLLGVTPASVRYQVDPEYRERSLARTREANADPVKAPRSPKVRHLRRPGGKAYCGRGQPDGQAGLPTCELCRRYRNAYHR